jgi:four helix bundle protein
MKKGNYRSLEAYQKAFQLGLDVLNLSAVLPMEASDTVSKRLVSSSQAIGVKIAEGWARRSRPGALEAHIQDAELALAELQLWMIVGLEYKYITAEQHDGIEAVVNELSYHMQSLNQNWHSYQVHA